MKKKASTRAFGRKNTRIWPLCASTATALASFALLSTLALPARAQADDDADGGDDGIVNPDLVAKIDQLEGVKIDQTNYAQYVTTGNPGAVSDTASLQKVFFIYNPSTKKFLSMGGYWGTHAALSDTPHPFWLQTETETSADQYLTYPSREGETSAAPSFMSPLLAAATVQVGSQEGNTRSYAAYKRITYTDKDGQKTDLLSTLGADYKPNGAKFYTDALPASPLVGGAIEAEMDLTDCHTYTTNKAANIISFGTNIDKWGNGEGQQNIHLYYWGDGYGHPTQNPDHGNLEIEYVNKSWSEHRRIFLKVSGKQIRVTLSQKGLVIRYTDAQGAEQTAIYYPAVGVGYVAGKENQTVYFRKNSNGSMAVDQNGAYTADATLTAETGVPYTYSGPVQADGTPTEQRFFLSTAIEKSDASYDTEGHFLSYAYKADAGGGYNIGAYTDRTVPQKNYTDIKDLTNVGQVKKAAQWLLDYPAGMTDNECLLTLSMPFDDEGNYISTGDRTFYLRPSAKYVKGPGPGAQNTYYPFDTDTKKGEYTARTDAEQADLYADTQSLGQIAQWKIVTALQYYEAAMEVKQELQNPTDLSFLVQDNSFRRDNGKLKHWQINGELGSSAEDIAAGKAKLRIGLDQYYKVDPQVNQYYNASGKALTKEDSKEYNQEVNIRSRYNGVCITNGGYGDFYQDVTVYAPGWYTVACKGLTNRGAELFAQTADGNRKAAALGSFTDAMYAVINAASADDCYWPFDANHPIYNSVALMTDPYVQESEQDDNFETKLWIYVPGASQSEPKTLRIGVSVKSGDGTATMSNLEGVEETDWTVFSAFRLYYGGQTDEQQYLVLDEDWTDYSTLESIQPITSTRTLCLNRQLKEGRWNTIILPVGLTREQFRNTFGTGAELAKLSEMTEREIRFDRVQAEQKDQAGNQYWLMPNTPYIILPEIEGGEPVYEGQYTPLRGSDVVKITVPEGHYKIPGVQFTAPYIPTVTTSDDLTAWSMDYLKATVKGTTYPYLVSTAAVSGPADGGETAPTLTAYGMLAANYTEDNGTKKPVTGRYQLNDAYVMSGGYLTRLSSDGTASKGYRCFFAYRGKDGGTEIPTLYIDGVSQVTLGIDDILAADRAGQAAAAPRREGVYTLYGQQLRTTSDTTGLPAGLYIVGGRKVLVK